MFEIIYIIVMMLLLFGVTVFVHEWGHFFAARRCGLVVESFSIGFGPAIWKKEKDGISYKIGIIPFGGYVAIPQLDPVGMEKVQGDNETDRESLPEVSPWKKIIVSVSGPLCNIIFAIPLALIVTSAETSPAHTTIGYVATNSVAYAEGLRGGDEILQVNWNDANDWYSIISEDLLTEDNENVLLLVRSGDETKEYTLPSRSTMEAMYPARRPLVASVSSKDPAGRAGIKTGDIITELDGVRISWWHQITDTVQQCRDREVSVSVLRNDKTLNLKLTPRYDEEGERLVIGIMPGDPGMLAWTMEGTPLTQIGDDALKIFRLLKALTNKQEAGNALENIGGPVTIFVLIWFSLKLGIFYAIGLIRFININLAVLNLLPIPVLDGGHICFALWEIITRRKAHPKVVASLVNVFAILLISAMVFLSWRDSDRQWNISRFFKGSKEKPAPAQVEQPAEKQPSPATE